MSKAHRFWMFLGCYFRLLAAPDWGYHTRTPTLWQRLTWRIWFYDAFETSAFIWYDRPFNYVKKPRPEQSAAGTVLTDDDIPF